MAEDGLSGLGHGCPSPRQLQKVFGSLGNRFRLPGEPLVPRARLRRRYVRELALIEAIGAALARRDGSRVVRWLGDDAAVVRGDALAVTSVDVMVEGTHFRLGPATPADVGHRALAAALSDLAAMGAAPGEA